MKSIFELNVGHSFWLSSSNCNKKCSKNVACHDDEIWLIKAISRQFGRNAITLPLLSNTGLTFSRNWVRCFSMRSFLKPFSRTVNDLARSPPRNVKHGSNIRKCTRNFDLKTNPSEWYDNLLGSNVRFDVQHNFLCLNGKLTSLLLIVLYGPSLVLDATYIILMKQIIQLVHDMHCYTEDMLLWLQHQRIYIFVRTHFR